MENITRIADLPMNGGGNGHNNPVMQNQMTLPSVSISEMKKKTRLKCKRIILLSILIQIHSV